MSTTSKIFLDSSFFVEKFKGKHLDYFHFITQSNALECCITEVVCSEYWFYLFALIGGKAPLTLKEGGGLPAIAAEHDERFNFFEKYSLIEGSHKVVQTALEMTRKHNLLPNDALILGTCIAYQIPFLASCDSDFKTACESEGVRLVTPDNYKVFFKSNAE